MKRDCPLLERKTETRTLKYSKDPWVIKQCLETGFVFLENPPEYTEFEENFAWEVTSKKEKARRKADEPLFSRLSDLTTRFRRTFFKRNKWLSLAGAALGRSKGAEIRTLDLGCGRGSLSLNIADHLRQARDIKAIPHGIEVSKFLARTSDERFRPYGGRVVQNNALDGLREFGDGFFDLILMSSFLEHEIQPKAVLREGFRTLKAGGIAIIKVPNFACWNRVIRQGKWCGFRYPDHVNYFTPETLKWLVRDVGFKVDRMTFLDRMPTSDNMYIVIRKPAQQGFR